MKRPQLRIEIPEPCSEDWAKMSPKEQGRHCDRCEKVVVDFSSMSDAELIDFFVVQKKKACGHFNSNQLDRNIMSPPPPATNSTFPSLVLAGSISLISLSVAAQSSSHTRPSTHQMIRGEVDPMIQDSIAIQGHVNFEDSGISDVLVQIPSGQYKTHTNSDGSFELLLPFYLINKELSLTFSHPDYQHHRQSVDVPFQDMRVQLQQAVMELPEFECEEKKAALVEYTTGITVLHVEQPVKVPWYKRWMFWKY